MCFLLDKKVNKEEFKQLYDEAMKKQKIWTIMFNNYLNEMYDNYESQHTLWNKYVANIQYVEDAKGKSVYLFSTQEIRELISIIPTASIITKKDTLSVIKNYIDYVINVLEENIFINPCDIITEEDILKDMEIQAQNKLVSKEYIYDLIKKAIERDMDSQVILPVLLSYYGVIGKDFIYMKSARPEHINREELTMDLYEDEEYSTTIPVDEMFVFWIDKLISLEGNNGDIYYTEGLIVKSKRAGTILTTQAYQTRILAVCNKCGVPKFAARDLFSSRKIELLLEIRKKRILTGKDFDDITQLFEPNSSRGRYNTLRLLYESTTGDKVQSKCGFEESMYGKEDINGEEVVRSIKHKIRF